MLEHISTILQRVIDGIDVEEERKTFFKKLEREYYNEFPRIRKAIANFREEITKELGEKVNESRINYLESQLNDLNVELTADTIRYGQTENKIEKQFIMEHIINLEKAIERKIMHIRCLKSKKQGITPDMILRAREYPITEILGYKGRGNMLCIVHQEKHPSMSIKNNRVKCFGCGWRGDSIDCYMILHNVSFVEAVKALQ